MIITSTIAGVILFVGVLSVIVLCIWRQTVKSKKKSLEIESRMVLGLSEENEVSRIVPLPWEK